MDKQNYLAFLQIIFVIIILAILIYYLSLIYIYIYKVYAITFEFPVKNKIN